MKWIQHRLYIAQITRCLLRDGSKIRGGEGWCKHGEGHGFSCKHKREGQTIWCKIRANFRLRAVPLFSYSPSRADREKQAARKLVSGRKAKKKGTTDKASAFDLCIAPTTQKCDWLMLGSVDYKMSIRQYSSICALQSITCHG